MQISSKLRRGRSDISDVISHWCPACEEVHVFTLHNSNGPHWSWDGNVDAPSFTPSMLIRVNTPDLPHYQPNAASSVCHYILTAGIINYCADSTHAMSGQSVPLPDLPTHMKDD